MAATSLPFLFFLSVCSVTRCEFQLPRATRKRKRHSILFRYRKALEDQPRQAILPEPLATVVPAALAVAGQTFVVTSTWALGITGTFLGDYFGILMDHRVEGYVAFLCSALSKFTMVRAGQVPL